MSKMINEMIKIKSLKTGEKKKIPRNSIWNKLNKICKLRTQW